MHVQVYVHTCTCNTCTMDSRVYWICNPREYIQLHEGKQNTHVYIHGTGGLYYETPID